MGKYCKWATDCFFKEKPAYEMENQRSLSQAPINVAAA